MDKLISADTVRTRASIDSDLDNDDFIGSAILAAQQRIETYYGSPIGEALANVDRFRLDPDDNYAQLRNGLFRLRLRRGLLKNTPVVENAAAWNGPTWTTLLDGTDYFIDMEQGIVSVDQRLRGTFARVTYDAGFKTGDTLPDWLIEVITGLTPSMFATVNPTNRNAEATTAYTNLYNAAMDVLASHLRSKSLILRPL